MQRKPAVAIFGSDDLADAPAVASLCEDLGSAVVGLGCRVVCGGLGGVMEAVCRGARSHPAYQSGDTIGILPTADSAGANPYVDIAIPTGLGYFRNMLVARAGDACIAVRGGSGTLSEIAMAWQLDKEVAVMAESGGWAHRLAGEPLDHRCEGGRTLVALADVEAAVSWLRQVLKG